MKKHIIQHFHTNISILFPSQKKTQCKVEKKNNREKMHIKHHLDNKKINQPLSLDNKSSRRHPLYIIQYTRFTNGSIFPPGYNLLYNVDMSKCVSSIGYWIYKHNPSSTIKYNHTILGKQFNISLYYIIQGFYI